MGGVRWKKCSRETDQGPVQEDGSLVVVGVGVERMNERSTV